MMYVTIASMGAVTIVLMRSSKMLSDPNLARRPYNMEQQVVF